MENLTTERKVKLVANNLMLSFDLDMKCVCLHVMNTWDKQLECEVSNDNILINGQYISYVIEPLRHNVCTGYQNYTCSNKITFLQSILQPFDCPLIGKDITYWSVLSSETSLDVEFDRISERIKNLRLLYSKRIGPLDSDYQLDALIKKTLSINNSLTTLQLVSVIEKQNNSIIISLQIHHHCIFIVKTSVDTDIFSSLTDYRKQTLRGQSLQTVLFSSIQPFFINSKNLISDLQILEK